MRPSTLPWGARGGASISPGAAERLISFIRSFGGIVPPYTRTAASFARGATPTVLWFKDCLRSFGSRCTWGVRATALVAVIAAQVRHPMIGWEIGRVAAAVLAPAHISEETPNEGRVEKIEGHHQTSPQRDVEHTACLR